MQHKSVKILLGLVKSMLETSETSRIMDISCVFSHQLGQHHLEFKTILIDPA